MSLSDEQWEFTKDVSMLIFFADARGFKLTCGEVYRTVQQQALHVKAGLSWTMNSQHLNRLAIYFNIFKDVDGDGIEDYLDTNELMEANAKLLGTFWASLSPKNKSGFLWGYDYGHFEREA